MANNTGFSEVKSICSKIETSCMPKATSDIRGTKGPYPNKKKSGASGKESGFHGHGKGRRSAT